MNAKFYTFLTTEQEKYYGLASHSGHIILEKDDY